jgi:ribosomal protein L37AE/L43A
MAITIPSKSELRAQRLGAKATLEYCPTCESTDVRITNEFWECSNCDAWLKRSSGLHCGIDLYSARTMHQKLKAAKMEEEFRHPRYLYKDGEITSL